MILGMTRLDEPVPAAARRDSEAAGNGMCAGGAGVWRVHHTHPRRHVLPNLMHLVLIALVMDFSGLVLAEAVLSYVGIGVDPGTVTSAR